jgi:GrpB-like predicted nucleotidyltransferase (UPF0157 family)
MERDETAAEKRGIGKLLTKYSNYKLLLLDEWESDWFEHRLFKGPDTDIHLHVFSSGTSEIDRMLRFRDWLRSNKTDRKKYAQVKRSLAKNKWRHIQHYADAKTSIVQEIMERANANI